MVTQIRVEDKSDDKAYFTITPRLVWALSRDPYDYILWSVIKSVAGDAGECYISTDDLAALAMMSMGKVSMSRRHLLDAGLLEGQVRKDPGYPQPVWHLTIPNLWPRNLELSERLRTIRARVEFKREQKAEVWAEGREKRERERERKHQKSLHTVKPSHSEGGTSHSETKKIQRRSSDDDDGQRAAATPLPILEGDQVEAYSCLRCEPIRMHSDQALPLAQTGDLDAVRGWCCVAWADIGPDGIKKPAGFVHDKLTKGAAVPDVAPAQMREFQKWVTDWRVHRLPQEAERMGLEMIG